MWKEKINRSITLEETMDRSKGNVEWSGCKLRREARVQELFVQGDEPICKANMANKEIQTCRYWSIIVDIEVEETEY